MTTPDSVEDAEPVVHLHRVGKRYGERWAIRDIDLTIRPGEIVGFIGPNGAGKTTLMRLMAGLSAPTEGQITVVGTDLHGKSLHTPPGIGLMLEEMGFIPHQSGRANLELFAGLRRIAGPEAIAETLVQVGLDPSDRRPVRAYSLGMRQRLLLAQALMDQPKLLLLDEPTNGLDPAGIVALRRLLVQLADEGKAVFVASHLLTEVERICHRVLFVRDGKLLKEVDLRTASAPRIRVVVSHEHAAEALLRSGLSVERVADEPGGLTFVLTPDGPMPDLFRRLVDAGIDLEEIHKEHRSLEKEFLALFQ
jgi:ABC-type multidrug transport system ATPase subunit